MTQSAAKVAQELRENWFWSAIFRDHAIFIFDNLAPDQERLIRQAQGFKQALERLAAESEQVALAAGIRGPAGTYALTGLPAEQPMAGLQGQELLQCERQAEQLNRNLLEALNSLAAFKQELLQSMLECKVKSSLGPSLVAHMIVEAEEAQRTLGPSRAVAALPPPLEALHYHLVWLRDSAGHAVALNNRTDGVEQAVRLTTEHFQRIFDGMHLKALELYTMLRVAPRMVGALKRLNQDALAQADAFRCFLAELREHVEGCQVLGSIMPLLADHMLREELYYMEKIMAVTQR